MDESLQVKIHDLFEQASPQVQEFLLSDEVDKSSAILGKLYSLPISKYLPLKNAITLFLLGAIDPSDAVSALQTNLSIDETTAYKLASDLDKTVFQKFRVAVIGPDVGEVKEITVGQSDEAKKDELRKVILDTTKRESAVEKSPVPQGEKKQKKPLIQGSRSQLVEQLNLLGSIPDDDEIKSRLDHIRSQIKNPEVVEEEIKPVSKELENMLSGGGKTIVSPQSRVATYSSAPTAYNVDPYREIFED